MKLSKIDAVVAEMEAELVVVVKCLKMFEDNTPTDGMNAISRYEDTLKLCIARLTNGSTPTAPKPTRARKGKAGLPKPELGL